MVLLMEKKVILDKWVEYSTYDSALQQKRYWEKNYAIHKK
jgi:hypothetical protein